MLRPPPRPTLFPYTTLFRSADEQQREGQVPPPGGRSHDHVRQERRRRPRRRAAVAEAVGEHVERRASAWASPALRSEEHTSELQSHSDLVCRLLLEKKNGKKHAHRTPGARRDTVSARQYGRGGGTFPGCAPTESRECPRAAGNGAGGL